MDVSSVDSGSGGGPAMAAMARHRGPSIEATRNGPSPFDDPRAREAALAGYFSLVKNIDLRVLGQYNAVWSYILDRSKGVVLAHASRVPHKKEDPNAVWNRLIESHRTLGAIMYAMQQQYQLDIGHEMNPKDDEAYIMMVAKYFQLKTTFRAKVDKAMAAVLKMIRTAERIEKKGYQPERAAVWGERVALQAQYRKTVFAEASRMRRLAKYWMQAADQIEKTVGDYDPALTRVQHLLTPPESIIAQWTDEFAALDDTTKMAEWNNEVDGYLAHHTRQFMEERQKLFFKDDDAWNDFCRVNHSDLKKRLQKKERALTEFRSTTLRDEVRRIFPGFTPETKGSDVGSDGEPDTDG